MYFILNILLILFCSHAYSSDGVKDGMFHENYSRFYGCHREQRTENIEDINTERCKYQLHYVLDLFKKIPLVTQIGSKSLFDQRKEYGHVTFIIHLQRLAAPVSWMAWASGFSENHCALVTEHYDRNDNLISYLISLQQLKSTGGSSGDFSGSGSGGAMEHHVLMKTNKVVINNLVWNYGNTTNPECRKYYDRVAYYPYKTFKVPIDKLESALMGIKKDRELNSYPYNPYSGNCCSYVVKKLKEMGIDIDTNGYYVSGIFDSNLLKERVNKINPEVGQNPAQVSDNDGLIVEECIAKRFISLLQYYNEKKFYNLDGNFSVNDFHFNMDECIFRRNQPT